MESSALRDWGRKVLRGDAPIPTLYTCLENQVKSRQVGDDEALAIWSRLRWRQLLKCTPPKTAPSP